MARSAPGPHRSCAGRRRAACMSMGRAHHDGRRGRTRGRGDGTDPGSCSYTVLVARRRTSPTMRQCCEHSRGRVRSSYHGESDKPEDPLAYSFGRLVADTLAVADGVGLSSFRLLGFDGAWSSAGSCSPIRPGRGVGTDGHVSSVPGLGADLMEFGAAVARARQDVWKALTKLPLHTLAYGAMPRSGRVPGFRTASGTRSEVSGPRWWRRSPGRVATSRPTITRLDLVSGRRPTPFPRSFTGDGQRDPAR
jgi:hypothetical protein